MKSKLNIYKLMRILAFPVIVVVVITNYIQVGAQIQDEDAVILDYEASKGKTVSEKRKKKNKRFNHRGSAASKKKIKEFPVGVTNLPTMVHWWVGRSALPIETANAIVIGTVTNREAHLSDDETSIYTEYELTIEKIFKDSSGSLNIGATAAFVRHGGNVRFKPDRIQKYSINRHGVLKKNRRYLLFLEKYNEEDLFIVTGYEFSGKKVVPVDGQDRKDPKSALPFNKYLNADESVLLQDLQTELKAAKRK